MQQPFNGQYPHSFNPFYLPMPQNPVVNNISVNGSKANQGVSGNPLDDKILKKIENM